MNIFVTDRDPVKAAISMDDKRLKHMPRESIEMLATYIHFVTGRWIVPFPLWGDDIRRASAKELYNHPCCKWVRGSKVNSYWLLSNLLAMIDEHQFRGYTFNMYHFINEITPYIPETELVPNSFRNSSLYKEKEVVQAYRETMIHKWTKTDKVKPIWTNRTSPDWFTVQQKLDI